MARSTILSEIDKEISNLKEARALLSEDTTAKRGAGRSKKIAAVAQPAKQERNISPEGRKRIAEAVRKRWAKQKKETAG